MTLYFIQRAAHGYLTQDISKKRVTAIAGKSLINAKIMFHPVELKLAVKKSGLAQSFSIFSSQMLSKHRQYIHTASLFSGLQLLI